MEIYDGFESKGLSKIWSNKLLAPNSFEIQSRIVKSGNSAIKITLNSKDNFQEGEEQNKSTERNELVEEKELRSVEDKEYSYSFSVFIPQDFPIVPIRLVLAQWKQLDEEDTAKINNPILAIRYVDRELFITLQTTEKRIKLFSTKDEVRGKWMDFRLNIKFSRKNGFVKTWLDEKEIISYVGRTAYDEEQGYPKKGKFYFKMGLYRDCIEKPMTIYFDEYHKIK